MHMHPYTCMHSRINIFMHAGVYIWINIPSGRQIPIIMLFIYLAKALRPLGLAVTASDYLDSMQIDTSASDVLERCLQRYMMNPSLCQLENLDPAAISGFGRSTRLRDRILERQHSLGVHFTRQALEGLCESYEGWASWTVRAKRFCLSNLALHGPETFQSQDRSASTILAWASYNFDADLSRGRVNGFQQDRSERDQWLPPIQVEHERPRNTSNSFFRCLPAKSVADTVSYA